jgi:hypothetical protein
VDLCERVVPVYPDAGRIGHLLGWSLGAIGTQPDSYLLAACPMPHIGVSQQQAWSMSGEVTNSQWGIYSAPSTVA